LFGRKFDRYQHHDSRTGRHHSHDFGRHDHSPYNGLS
jgi:hypothetical protein